MGFKKFTLQPEHEIRGLMIRLYPDADTERKLRSLEDDQRRLWNWLVSWTEQVIDARQGYALRHGLVAPRPVRPDYDGMQPDEARDAKRSHQEACRAWHAAVHEATKNVPACGYRKFSDLLTHFGAKHDYQMLGRVLDGEREIRPCAHALQALTKNYFTKSQRRKQFRKSSDSMPLQVRSGQCFELGDFGVRRGNQFYNCQIKFNGLKIRGRLPGMAPAGRVLEGVSLTRKADGWWASIKQEVPIRTPPPAMPGSVVGVDVGLDNLAAMSDGSIIPNARGKAFSERIAGRQAQGLPVGRLQLQASRHAKHEIYNKIVKPLSSIETIKVEKLPPFLGHNGSVKKSSMRTIVAVLRERYGERVREVDPSFTSQDCSQCGHRSEETWGYKHGRIGFCPKCGHTEDRDLNAARNIAAREPI
jgi:hypothetical protein